MIQELTQSNDCIKQNSNPKYAVISLQNFQSAGIGSICIRCLTFAYKALQEGYIPLIDGKTHKNQYFKDGQEHKDNIWEYYFKQPCEIMLEELNKPNTIIKKIASDSDFENSQALQFPYTYKEVQKCHNKNFYSKMFSLSTQAKQYIESNYNKVIGNQKEILGIYCRGTDYINMKPSKHNIPATPEKLIKEAHKLYKKYHYEKIYVATEDLNIYNRFKEEFGDRLLPNPQFKFNNYQNSSNTLIADIKVERENHNYRLGMEYLGSMYILAKCKYLIASNKSAGIGLIVLFSDFYKDMKYIHIWNLGQYKTIKNIHYKNFAQRLFSVKNEYNENTIRKVITILGIKFKFIKKIR